MCSAFLKFDYFRGYHFRCRVLLVISINQPIFCTFPAIFSFSKKGVVHLIIRLELKGYGKFESFSSKIPFNFRLSQFNQLRLVTPRLVISINESSSRSFLSNPLNLLLIRPASHQFVEINYKFMETDLFKLNIIEINN